MDENETSTRRGLLGALARSAARRAREGTEAIGPGLLAEFPPEAVTPAPRRPVATRRPARAPVRAASSRDLLALAEADGLAHHGDQLAGLARMSARLIAKPTGEADGWILTGEEWSDAGDEVLLAMIHLRAVPEGARLPDHGWLTVFVESPDSPVSSNARRAHAVILDTPAPIPDAATTVSLHPELVLPRRWHEAVQDLDLDEAEGDSYDRLRLRLQALQGVESDADGGSGVAYHRLLGYPNETTGTMPLDSTHARLGSPAGALPSEPDGDALPSSQWQLLLQVSVGDLRRAYVWIHGADLEQGEFGRLCAFVR